MPIFHRKPNRLPLKQLYQGGNWYFVTICVQGKCCVFEMIWGIGFDNSNHYVKNGDTEVASTEEIIKSCLFDVVKFYDQANLDYWVIMPNHIHFIIVFRNQNEELSLSAFVKSFKLHSQKQIIVEATSVSPLATKVKHQLYNFDYHKFWQKSFYDHVIRDEEDLYRIRQYIINNPAKWKLDEENPDNYKTRYI